MRTRRSRPKRQGGESLEPRVLLTIDIQFNYDALGAGSFFTSERRNALNTAASVFESRIQDTLAGIPVSDGSLNRWQPSIPGANGGSVNLPARSISSNTVIIYVGISNYSGSLAARGGSGIRINSFEVTRDLTITKRGREWIELLLHRGKATSEYGAWGGAIYFDNSGRDWYAGSNPSGIGSGQTDFIATARHEIGHVLGFANVNLYKAIADANPTLNMGALRTRKYGWNLYASGSGFTGPRSKTAWDGSGNVPIDGTHWRESITSDGVETAMDSSGDTGSSHRRRYTSLDWAGLDDIGWTINYPPALSLTVNGNSTSPVSVTETDSDFTIPAVVSRSTVSGSLAGSLTVSVTSSDTGVFTVPSTVTIPANQSSTSFNITIKPDVDFVDELATLTIASSIATNAPLTSDIKVVDDEDPELAWSISPTTVTESSVESIANVRIGRTGSAVSTPTTVTITSPDTSELSFDGSSKLIVTIPANASQSEPFSVTVVDDDVFDGDQTVQLKATASGFVDALQSVIVRDNELPTLTVNAPATLTEGSDFVDITVARNTTQGVANVILNADIASEIEIEDSTQQIADGASLTVFRVRAKDDAIFDGTVDVVLTATALGTNRGSKSLQTLDNEQPELSLTIVPSTFSETGGTDVATATVTRTGPVDAAMQITVQSSDTAKVTPGQTTVTIPIGLTSAEFQLNAIDNTIFDQVARRKVTITASAAEAANIGSTIVTVTENEQASRIDVDQDGTFSPLQDGIVVIRYMAGFTGTALVDGAVNSAGDRTSAEAIIAGLKELTSLDVDGNGQVASLTDGILLIRYYAGFTGDSLITGAIDAGATRTSAAEIIALLDSERNGTSSQGPVPGTAAAPSAPGGHERRLSPSVGRSSRYPRLWQTVISQDDSVAVPHGVIEQRRLSTTARASFDTKSRSDTDHQDELDQIFQLPDALGDLLFDATSFRR
jgi:hypothetical protein